jgi:predicted metal-dependent peptidase
MTSENTVFNLNMHTHRLLTDEPFFAALSRYINKRACSSIPTAAVRVTNDGHYEMIYNPDFMVSLIESHKQAYPDNNDHYVWIRGILMHEFYHIIYGHLTTRMPAGGLTKEWNIAMDLAINSHISNLLPDNACIPGRGMFSELPTALSAEAYYKFLTENSDGGKNTDSVQEFDNHEWGDANSPTDNFSDNDPSNSDSMADSTKNQIANERLKGILRKAATEASNRNWGSVSAAMREEIMNRLETKVDWRKVLSSFIRASQKNNRRSTVKRINRRFPYIHAGKRSSRVANVAISIDQSGSVSDELLASFFSELEKLATIAQFTVIPFDTAVDDSKVFIWKKGQKRPWERVLCGGTDFDAPTDYVNDRDFDGHIILTDMGASKPKPSKIQRLWMTDPINGKNVPFQTNERIVIIDA